MLHLPPLVVGRQTFSLPIADRSAETLLGLLLFLTDPNVARDPIARGASILGDPLDSECTDDALQEPVDPSSRHWCDSLAECLRADPPLLLWTVCTAHRIESIKLDNVARAARWLLDQASRVLCFESIAADTSPAERNAETTTMLRRAFFLAAMSSAILTGENEAIIEKARLRGLLYEADRWFDAFRSESTDDGKRGRRPASPAPPWLKRQPGGAIGRALKTALADPAKLDKKAKTARRSAASAAKNQVAAWFEDRGAAIARLFPTLVARLMRLADLTDRYERTLWTEKLESVAEFAAGAGHEMNNPLGVISGWAQMMMRGEPSEDNRRLLAKIVAQAGRVYEMIADMMVFARPPLPEPARFELVAAVREAVDAAARVDWEVDVRFHFEADPSEISVETDRAQVATVVSALCRNAAESLRLARRPGRVDVHIERADPNFILTVTDDGPGISEPAERHLFDPFYSERQAGRGLGLGLSKSWRIVERLGGRIEVINRSPDGTTFRVILPLHVERPENDT